MWTLLKYLTNFTVLLVCHDANFFENPVALWLTFATFIKNANIEASYLHVRTCNRIKDIPPHCQNRSVVKYAGTVWFNVCSS